MKSFTDGLFYIQDPSTLLAPCVLAPQKGEAVLDVCAAPGGKTTFIAALLENEGKVLAQDLDDKRLELVRENARRTGASCVTTNPKEFLPDSVFDRVLVDAPCSNTGVMRRRVELRWRVSPEEVARLAKTQLALLKEAARKTRLGGTLVYSTCSLEREENEAVTREFLASHGKFKLEEEKQLTPMKDGVDGAYCARFTQAR